MIFTEKVRFFSLGFAWVANPSELTSELDCRDFKAHTTNLWTGIAKCYKITCHEFVENIVKYFPIKISV